MKQQKQTKNNLVENFIKAVTCCGEPLRVVMDGLNDNLRTNYRTNKLSDWRNGHPVPDHVRVYMMSLAVLPVLRKNGVKVMLLEDDEVDAIVSGLMPLKK